MLGYFPNTGVVLARNSFKNEKNKTTTNGTITSYLISNNDGSRKNTSNHMNGHVVSSRDSDLGPGYTIVEPPTAIVPERENMAPTPGSFDAGKIQVKFSQATSIPDLSDPLRVVSNDTEPKDDSAPWKELQSQSTQTDFLQTSELYVHNDRTSNTSICSNHCDHNDEPVLRFGNPTSTVSRSSRTHDSDSSVDEVSDAGDTESVLATPVRNPTNEIPLSAILIGDSDTGKSCLLARLSENSFFENHDVTIGIDFSIARFVLPDGRPIRLQLWDTAGQEKFRSITSSYYRRAMGVLLVYDVTRKDSLKNIVDLWRKEVEKYAEPDVVLMLVGNKIDLDDYRTITTRIGAKVAGELGASFYEVSAKEDRNVKMAFQAFSQDILENVYTFRNPCMSSSAIHIDFTNHDRKEDGKTSSVCSC